MNSPFQVFRKHQKTAMVALVFMALFAFVVMDSVSQMSGEIPPTLLAMLFGTLLAGLFWFFGSKAGKSSEYAIAGAILGVLLGLLVPRLTSDPPAVRTNAGDLSPRALQELVYDRTRANQFMAAAYSKAVAPPDNPFLMQFWEQGLRPYQFQVTYDRPTSEDVVLGYLLRQEAEEMGIEVSDDAVNAHIKQATGGKLTREDFREIRRNMNISEAVLYDILKRELKAKLAMQLKRPADFPTPHEYWEMYKKINVKAQLAVAPVPVEPFIEQVKEPSAVDLAGFFDQYKNRFPTDAVTPEPAFGQPRKVRVAYLQADYEKLQAQVEKENPVTDEDVERFYNENKETLYKNNLLKTEGSNDGETPAAGPELKAPDAGAPADSTPKTPDAEKTPETPAAPKDDTPKAEKSEAPADLPEGEKTPDAKAKSSEESSEASPETAGTSEGDEDEAEGTESDEAAASQASENETPAAADEKKEEAPAEPKKEDPKAEDPKADEKPSSDEKPTEPAGEEKPADEEPKKDERLPEYKPLDDILRQDIRDQLLEQRVQERMAEKMLKAYETVDELSFQMNAPEGEKSITPQEYSDRVQEYAKKEGLRYVVTDLLTAEQFADPEKHALAGAVEAAGDPMRRRGVTEMLFGTEREIKYIPARAVDQLSNDQFVYWKIADVPPKVPTLDEPGIREQVVEAWKRQQAQPLAQKRAEELAEMVRKSDKDISEVLGETTVTGATEGEQLTVRETDRFSWIRTMSAAPTNPMAGMIPRLAEVNGVEKAGPDFMQVVFETLEEGEVGVAPNADRTEYYVVKVQEKFPSSAEGLEAMRKQFLQTNLFSGGGMFGQPTPYDYMAAADRQQLIAGFDQQLMMKYDVRFLQTGERSGLMEE